MICFKILSQCLIILLSLLLVDCSPADKPANKITPTIGIAPILTSVMTESPAHAGNLDLTNLTTNCVVITDASSREIMLRGSLVINSTVGSSYILNLKTKERIYLEEASAGELSVSPNMQKIAYINYDTEQLVIRDAYGEQLKLFDEFSSHLSLIEWLDNENIAINKHNKEKPASTDYSLLTLNVFTGSKNEFYIEDFPNGNGDPKVVSWIYFGNIVPNSQLTRVIYPVKGEGYPVILWDIEFGNEKRRVYFSDSLPVPVWSADGTKLLVTAPLEFNGYVNFSDKLPYHGGNELFVVDDEGQIERLTYLATKYKGSVFLAPSWSPSEQYIAFNVENQNEPDFGLSILNMNTGEIINYCIRDNWSQIHWSPDGKQIAFTVGNGFEASEVKAYILDIEENIAVKIADNAEAAGWVINR